MLPFFAAPGHNNCTKCAWLYLQDSTNMCQCLTEAMFRGLFTVRKNPSLFWSGTWSDMIIEQSLVRWDQTSDGLINITHNDAARAKWLLSAHILAQYSESLRYLTDTCTGTWSEKCSPVTDETIWVISLHFLSFLIHTSPSMSTMMRNY